MKYRIIAPIVFIVGLLGLLVLMNSSDDTTQPVPNNPQPQQSAAPTSAPANDPFKGIKIP